MSRSTFSILPYINRQKVKADGTANILCRITVDGKSAAISTGISCTPQEWNSKKGEVRNARDNGRLASFLAEVKDKYNSLLTTNGIITVEMLKAVLKDKDTAGRFLLNFGDTIVEWYRTSKARQTFLHKRTWQKNLRAFVHSLDKDDIAFEDIDENFGEEYKLFLKRDQGRIDSYVNHCLLWLNMLMYKAVDRSIIRFNPIAKIGYEKKAAPKMTHISKADFIKMLSTPMADERTELARRCFIFASLTSLSYIDVKKLYPHHISENSDGRKFIRKEREKTGVEFFVPLHPIAEKILSLYNTTDDSKPVFPLGEKKDIYLDVHTLGMVLGISNKLGFHASRHTFGVLMLNEDIPIGSIAKMMGHADITSTQAKGIKVVMTILGNHDEAGMGNLSEAAAKDFAKELKAYLDIYGLDGIDFDDEYTSYNNSNPSPGFEKRSRANFARLVYECRQVFGKKLIGVYEYGSLDSPDGEVEGVKVGDIVDYMTYGYYQNQNPNGAFGREESHFENLPKSKYAPLPWKINDELNGGWSGFDKSKFQKVKDEGYGIQMFYNPKPLMYQYYVLLSEISEVLFDDGVEWSGKYWSRTGEAYQGKMLGYEDLVGEWKVTSSNSLFTYVDEEGNPRWWDWKGSQEFEKNVIIEKDEEGTGYVVYNWGTFPEITGKYPMHCDYYNGALLIYPQTIHEGDAEDPATYKMHFGTYSKNFQWKAYPNYDDYYMDGAIAPNGDMHIYGLGNRWAINPYKYVGGEIETDIFPDVPYFVSENYTMKKVR